MHWDFCHKVTWAHHGLFSKEANLTDSFTETAYLINSRLLSIVLSLVLACFQALLLNLSEAWYELYLTERYCSNIALKGIAARTSEMYSLQFIFMRSRMSFHFLICWLWRHCWFVQLRDDMHLYSYSFMHYSKIIEK